MGRRSLPVGLLVAALAATLPARATMFSKTYEFKPDTVLQVGTEIGEGLRLDTIQFVLAQDDGTPSGLFSGPRVKVAISNVGKDSVKLDMTVAVLDQEGRLVAVGSGGTKLFPLRPDRQMTYVLDFDRASAELPSGQTFKISIEPKP